MCWAGERGREASSALGHLQPRWEARAETPLVFCQLQGQHGAPLGSGSPGSTASGWGFCCLGILQGGRNGGWRGPAAGTWTGRGEAALLASRWLCLSCWPDARPPARSASGGGRRITNLPLPLAQQYPWEPRSPHCHLFLGTACPPPSPPGPQCRLLLGTACLPKPSRPAVPPSPGHSLPPQVLQAYSATSWAQPAPESSRPLTDPGRFLGNASDSADP